MKIEINVTKDDIKKGTQGDSEDCPVARAVKRALKENDIKVRKVHVGGFIEFNNSKTDALEGPSAQVPTPKIADKFIDNFDIDKEDEERKAPKPFKFSIKIPKVFLPAEKAEKAEKPKAKKAKAKPKKKAAKKKK